MLADLIESCIYAPPRIALVIQHVWRRWHIRAGDRLASGKMNRSQRQRGREISPRKIEFLISLSVHYHRVHPAERVDESS